MGTLKYGNRIRMGVLRAALALSLAVVAVAGPILAVPTQALAADSSATQLMYRLYNPNSGEHFYTGSAAEKDNVVGAGWRYEGIGWVAPVSSNVPVYRLYNPNAGDHHYTMSAAERDMLVGVGWRYEGIGWYSSETRAEPLYRQYNPNARTGTHNYTTSLAEDRALVSLGWRGEGIGWFGVRLSASTDEGKQALRAYRAMQFANDYLQTGILLSPKNDMTLVSRPGWKVVTLRYVMPASALWSEIMADSSPEATTLVRNVRYLGQTGDVVRVEVTWVGTQNPYPGWSAETNTSTLNLTFNNADLIISR